MKRCAKRSKLIMTIIWDVNLLLRDVLMVVLEFECFVAKFENSKEIELALKRPG